MLENIVSKYKCTDCLVNCCFYVFDKEKLRLQVDKKDFAIQSTNSIR